MPLNQLQQAFYDSVLNDITTGQHNRYLLTGSAGTGKTYTIGQLIAECADRDLQVTCLYPTHKAKNVGMSMVGDAGNTCTFSTCHSYLRRAGYLNESADAYLTDKASKLLAC